MNMVLYKKPVLHAVIWILIYLAAVSIGDSLTVSTGFVYSTGILLLALSLVLVLYLKKNAGFMFFGITRVTRQDARKVLFYIPLILLAFIQFASGIDRSISVMDVSAVFLLMVGTGFIEELLFRGFLFESIRNKSGINKAVIISGVTFGLGHIVNIARGYGYVELACQIIVAVAVGIVLALLVAVTKNIIPGILFHIMFNIGGSISNQAVGAQAVGLIAIIVVALPYALYLYNASDCRVSIVPKSRAANVSDRQKEQKAPVIIR